MTRYVFLEEANDLSELRNIRTIPTSPSTSRERACHPANCSISKTVSGIRHPAAARRVALKSGSWVNAQRKWRMAGVRRGSRVPGVTRDQPRRASAPTRGRPRARAARRRFTITTLVRSALFARLPCRRDAAPFSCARGRRRRPNEDARLERH